jgi:hypothetical protein
MSGAIPPLSNTPPWRGAYKAQGQLYLYLYLNKRESKPWTFLSFETFFSRVGYFVHCQEFYVMREKICMFAATVQTEGKFRRDQFIFIRLNAFIYLSSNVS